MKDEIHAGVEFLRQFLAKYGQLNQVDIDRVAAKLTSMLAQRYVNHWYVANPQKGQAFRCLRVKRSENYIDPVLERILADMSLSLSQLGLPNDFTLWIDPGEVSVRFGDQVGYTYSIARLETTTTVKRQQQQQPTPQSLIASDTKTTNSDEGKPKAAMIVESSANIFDEKLTAFI